MSNAADRSASTDDHPEGRYAGSKGHNLFQITYDDTGAEVDVAAPNGWRIREVISEGYRLLGETPRPGDRVEADGVDLAPYLDLHVNEFVERKIAPKAHFNIVSNTGGARSCVSVA